MLIAPKCVRSQIATMDVESALTVATARLWYVEMKKKQNESIKAFASEKDVFKFVSLVYLVSTQTLRRRRVWQTSHGALVL